jgi:hypothetical protein
MTVIPAALMAAVVADYQRFNHNAHIWVEQRDA